MPSSMLDAHSIANRCGHPIAVKVLTPADGPKNRPAILFRNIVCRSASGHLLPRCLHLFVGLIRRECLVGAAALAGEQAANISGDVLGVVSKQTRVLAAVTPRIDSSNRISEAVGLLDLATEVLDDLDEDTLAVRCDLVSIQLDLGAWASSHASKSSYELAILPSLSPRLGDFGFSWGFCKINVCRGFCEINVCAATCRSVA